MRSKFQISLTISFLFFYGCESMLTEPELMSDAEIIEMIRSSSKVEISVENIPTNSKDIITEDYYDYISMSAFEARDLGFEVKLAGLGEKIGARNEVYFNKKGRKLVPGDWGKKGAIGKGPRGKGGNQKGDFSGDDWKCFDLIFPITFKMGDGSIIAVETDDEAGWGAMRSWHHANRGADHKPEMQFPVVVHINEESVIINNDQELREVYGECRKDFKDNEDYSWGQKRRPCFKVIYPVTYTMPDGSSMLVADHSERDLKEWYSNNSGFEGIRPEIQYPVTIVYETKNGDSSVTINDLETMQSAKSECSDEWEKGFKRECFEMLFPLTYTMPDFSVITVESEEGYMAIKNWYVENPESKEKPILEYPVNIRLLYSDDENTFSVASEEEFSQIKKDCWEEWKEGEKKECFKLVYPIIYELPDGSMITVQSDDEEGWQEIKNLNVTEEDLILQYPVDITISTEEGDITQTINSAEEMRSAKSRCIEDWFGEDGMGEDKTQECFSMVFPITYLMPDNSSLTINNDEESEWINLRTWYEQNTGYNEEPTLQYPIEIVYRTEQGTTSVILNSDQEMEDAENNCWDERERE